MFLAFLLFLVAFSAYCLIAGTPHRATYGFCLGVNLMNIVAETVKNY
jgi:tetrahydromethanopterin S-methyltransferase subunit B